MSIDKTRLQVELNAARKRMFIGLCALLERNNIKYVILAGYDAYPDKIESDIDFLIDEQDLDQVTLILSKANSIPDAKLVQVLEHEISARYFVFLIQIEERLAFLHPDAAAGVRRRARLRMRGSEALVSRRWNDAGFWVPAAAVEFEYYLVKKVEKRALQMRHLESLRRSFLADQAGCTSVLTRLFGESIGTSVGRRIVEGDIRWLESNLLTLHERIVRSPHIESPVARARTQLLDWLRIARRVARPTGLVIAVLGPDGSGKTTVLDHLQRELAPAFRGVRRFHLRPHFGSTRPGKAVTDPHGQAPRGWMLGFAKMILFLYDYLWGWLRAIWPGSIRSTLILFDRYFHDMLVDPRRYRLPPKFPAAHWVAALIPKPHMWIVLTAPATTLLARKSELTPLAAESLDNAYRSLASSLPNAVLIDTNQPIETVLAQAVTAVCDRLESRMRQRALHS